ncbi:MAG: HNH endonuclease [Alphaproteobacteria bacterium]|nr:HNH endonuclease [Alphaproteobacteria bacterium]
MKPQDVKDLLNALVPVADKLDRKQVKQLYSMLIANGQYPVCPACNQPITTVQDFTWDHIVAASKGGSDDISNMVPMHAKCNELKGNQYFDELFEVEYKITTEIKLEVVYPVVEPAPVIVKKQKKRNVTRFKPWQHTCLKNFRKR